VTVEQPLRVRWLHLNNGNRRWPSPPQARFATSATTSIAPPPATNMEERTWLDAHVSPTRMACS